MRPQAFATKTAAMVAAVVMFGTSLGCSSGATAAGPNLVTLDGHARSVETNIRVGY